MRAFIFNKNFYLDEVTAVAASVSKDTSRPFLTHIYYDAKNLVATDGKRMAIFKAPEKVIEEFGEEKGYFDLEKNILHEVDEPGHFPEYWRCIPKFDEMNDIVPYKVSKANSGVQILLQIAAASGRRFNVDFGKAINSVSNRVLNWNVRAGYSALVINFANDFKYVVMPLLDN